MSKVQRQQTIARLIAKHEVTNQPQLVDLLAGEGISATQATVSRRGTRQAAGAWPSCWGRGA